MILLLGAVINAVLGGYASGTAGGVGRGAAEDTTTRATGDETKYEGRLNREESADYLKALREDLTGRYEDMRSTDSKAGVEQRPRPDGEIEVIEQAQTISEDERGSDSEEQEWTVSLRWRSTTDESDGQPGSAGN